MYRYPSPQQPQRPQRSSYSGPPSSAGYYRGQEMGRPVQEYHSPQVGEVIVTKHLITPNTCNDIFNTAPPNSY